MILILCPKKWWTLTTSHKCIVHSWVDIFCEGCSQEWSRAVERLIRLHSAPTRPGTNSDSGARLEQKRVQKMRMQLSIISSSGKQGHTQANSHQQIILLPRGEQQVSHPDAMKAAVEPRSSGGLKNQFGRNCHGTGDSSHSRVLLLLYVFMFLFFAVDKQPHGALPPPAGMEEKNF